MKRCLLTWLLALALLMSGVASSTVSVQAAETVSGSSVNLGNAPIFGVDDLRPDDLTRYYLDYITDYPDNIAGDHDYRRAGVLYSVKGTLFLFHRSSDYDSVGYRYYSLGVYADGVASQASSSDFSLALYEYYSYSRKDGKVVSHEALGPDQDATNPKKGSVNNFLVYSESDYFWSGYVFDSLDDAELYFLNNDDSGMIRDPDVVNPDAGDDGGDDADDSDWKSLIKKILKDVFGNPLALIGTGIQTIIEGIVSLAETLINIRDYIIEQLPQGISKALKGLFDTLQVPIDAIAEKLLEFYDFVKSKLDSIGAFLLEMIELWHTIPIKIGEAIAPYIPEDIKVWLSDALDRLYNLVDSFHEIMENGFNTLKSLADKFNSFIEDFFDFISYMLEGTFMNDITDAFFEMLREFLEPLEEFTINLFVPDLDKLQGHLTTTREKLGFIDDIKGAGEYLFNSLKGLGSGSAPVITINLGATTYRDLGSQTVTIDFSWYEPYKPTVDKLLAAFIYVGFIWNLFRHLPEIIQGHGMTISGFGNVLDHFSTKGSSSVTESDFSVYSSPKTWTGDLDAAHKKQSHWFE